MSRQLREIARRRASLVSRAHNKRLALSDNGVWTSGPFMIMEYLLDLRRDINARSSVLQYGAAILVALLPDKTIRLANRSLMIWMTLNSIRKKILQ